MASSPRPSSDADAPLAGVGSVAAGLRARRSRVAGITGARRLSGVGDVGRAALRFGALTFLSQSARRRELARTAGAAHMLVRPPDYYSGSHARDDALAATPIRTGDAAYDALLARRARKVRAAAPPQPAPRGLPSTVHRHGRSAAGPMTGPGSMLRRLTPAPVPVVPNAATTGGKLTIAATPAPQAPRRRQTRPQAQQRSPRGGDDRPGHRAPRQTAPLTVAPVARRSPLASPSPAQADPSATARSALGRLVNGPDAITTPSFDALLDSLSGRVPAAPVVESPAPRPDAGSSQRPATPPGAIDELAIARIFDRASSAEDAVDDEPLRPELVARASRAARALPIAVVSVHASSRALTSQPAEPGTVRRLSFARTSALAGRSPWDDVKRLPVGMGTTAVPMAARASATETVQRIGAVTRPSSSRSPRTPDTESARTAVAAQGSPAAPALVLRRARAGGGVSWTTSSAAPASRLALPRGLRIAPAAPTLAAGPASGSAGGGTESLAEAVRRVFGAPAASSAKPTSAAASRLVAPPAAIPVARMPDAAAVSPRPVASPATTERAQPGRPTPRTDQRRPVAPVTPAAPRAATGTGAATSPTAASSSPRYVLTASRPGVAAGGIAIARHWAALPDEPAHAATDAGTAAIPGSLFATPGTALAGLSGAARRSFARPGTVVSASTTHAPLARAEHAAADRRIARLDVSRLAVGAPTAVSRAVSTPADPAPTSVERLTAVQAAGLAAERRRARVTVRRLPLGAAAGPLAASRGAMLDAVGERRHGSAAAVSATRAPGATGEPAANHIARRLAALESPFELVRRAPVGGAPAIVLRAADAANGTDARQGAVPPVTGSATTASSRSVLLPGRRTAASVSAPTVSAASETGGTRSPRSMPARSVGQRRMLGGSLLLPTAGAASAAPSGPQPAGTHIAQRLAALAGSSSFDAVRRLPVGAPAAVVTATTTGGARSGRDAATAASRERQRTAPETAARSGRVAARVGHPPAAARDQNGGTPRVRRALVLPNARVLPSAGHHAADIAAARVAERPFANHVARRFAAAESPGDALRRLPVGASAAVVVASRPAPSAVATAGRSAADAGTRDQLVRRSGMLPMAPQPATAPGSVLPGLRSAAARAIGRTATPRSAARAAVPAAASATASRLRDLVATGAFEAPPGSPDRLQRAASATAAGSAPPMPVLRSAAERFEHVLRSADVTDRPVALPERFRPLAERIVGPRIAVQVVHGAVTRKALAAAGHAAATTERTIHLPTRPDAGARTMAIVAHELEHVAVPSAIPRFHGGVDSPEERQAIRTEQIVRRLARKVDERGGSTAAAGIAGLPVGGLTAFGRSGSGAPAAPPGPPIPASALSAGGGSSTSIQRSPARAAPSTAAGAPPADRTIRREVTFAPLTSPSPETDESTGSDQPPALSAAQLSAIIRAVEDRLLEEIERRGGLSRGAF